MAFPKLLQRLFQNNGAGDKLNQDILPDISYNDLTDKPAIPTVPTKVSAFENDAGYLTQHQSLDAYATKTSLKAVATSGSYNDLTDKPAVPTVDSALSATSENPVQNKVINSALDGKLSLLGGTMTGDIQFTDGDIWFNRQTLGIRGRTNDTYLEICPGPTSTFASKTGASLMMTGRDYTGNSIPKGCFFLTAANEANGNKSLVGSPDGSLTWCGKNVLTGNSAGLTVVAESYSANRWYRKYSDGWIEQGGTVSGTAANFKGYSPRVTTNFPVAFSQTPTIATIEVFPGGLYSSSSVRTGRLSLQTSGENSVGDTVYYYGVIEASSTGMTIRVTSSDYGASVTATVYYVVVGK